MNWKKRLEGRRRFKMGIPLGLFFVVSAPIVAGIGGQAIEMLVKNLTGKTVSWLPALGFAAGMLVSVLLAAMLCWRFFELWLKPTEA